MVATTSTPEREKQPPFPLKEVETDTLLPTSIQTQTLSSHNYRDLPFGYFLIALAALSFSGTSLLIRAAESKYGFPPMSALFLRGSMQTVFTLTAIATTIGFRTALQPITRRIKWVLVLRGLSGSSAMCLLYLALVYIPAGECQTIFFSNPIFLMILSSIFLKESFVRSDMIIAITSLVGVALVAAPSGDYNVISAASRIIGSTYSLIAAFLCGISFLCIRSLPADIHFLVFVLALGLGSFSLSIVFGGAFGLDFALANKDGVALVALSGLFGFAAQCLMTKGLQNSKGGLGALFLNIEIPILYAIGVVFLNDVPTAIGIIGSTLVLGSTVVIGVRRLLQS